MKIPVFVQIVAVPTLSNSAAQVVGIDSTGNIWTTVVWPDGSTDGWHSVSREKWTRR